MSDGWNHTSFSHLLCDAQFTDCVANETYDTHAEKDYSTLYTRMISKSHYT
jgi:hypothetical protein